MMTAPPVTADFSTGADSRSRGVVSRFAPSPTGRLHLGHAFSAIHAHDRARAAGGTFLLRIEDIDGTRSRGEHVAAIVEDLRWLGLEWDGPVLFQSARRGVHAAALERLRDTGLLYPCFCTRAEIAASLSAPHGPEPVYPGTCRGMAERERARRVAAGEQHAWRLDMALALARRPAPRAGARHKAGVTAGVTERDDGNAMIRAMTRAMIWHDEIAGRVVANPAAHGDVILARKDAPASYHLAVTLDDAAQGVTHVVRGADLFAATHVHRLLQALLGLPTPVYRHHALLSGPDGERLAKRHGAPTLESLRSRGDDGHRLADALRHGDLPIGFGTTNA